MQGCRGRGVIFNGAKAISHAARGIHQKQKRNINSVWRHACNAYNSTTMLASS